MEFARFGVAGGKLESEVGMVREASAGYELEFAGFSERLKMLELEQKLRHSASAVVFAGFRGLRDSR